MVCRFIASFDTVDTEDKAVASPNTSNASASEPLTEIQQPLFSAKVLHLRWPHSLHPNVPILFRIAETNWCRSSSKQQWWRWQGILFLLDWLDLF